MRQGHYTAMQKWFGFSIMHSGGQETHKMLEPKNITFKVEGENGKKTILSNINLHINKDKFVVITGPNGGGKSTLAKVVVYDKT